MLVVVTTVFAVVTALVAILASLLITQVVAISVIVELLWMTFLLVATTSLLVGIPLNLLQPLSG